MDDNNNALRILTFNSVVTYILAFLLVYIPTQVITFLAALSFDIPTRFSLFKITFPIADYSPLWTQQSIVGIYFATPITCLLIAIFSIRFIKLYSFFRGPTANLLVIWIYTHAMNILLGGIIVGIPLIKGTGYVISWLFFPSFVSLALVALACILLFINGLVIRNSFISLVPENKYLKNPYLSLTYKLPVVFFPALSINSNFFFLGFPDNSLYEKLLLITLFIQLFMVVPFSYNYFEIRDNYLKNKFSHKALYMLMVVVIIFFSWKVLHNKLFGE